MLYVCVYVYIHTHTYRYVYTYMGVYVLYKIYIPRNFSFQVVVKYFKTNQLPGIGCSKNTLEELS